MFFLIIQCLRIIRDNVLQIAVNIPDYFCCLSARKEKEKRGEGGEEELLYLRGSHKKSNPAISVDTILLFYYSINCSGYTKAAFRCSCTMTGNYHFGSEGHADIQGF